MSRGFAHDGAASGPKPRAGGAGYTIVEVMMALAVLTLGAAGVIAMQKATLIANTNARNLVTANEVAQAWMERLRVDALAWNEPAGVPDLTSDTAWLSGVSAGWAVPLRSEIAGRPVGSPIADVMGAEILGSDPSATAFCTQVKLTRFSLDPSLWALSRMMRVEVRVYWDKTGRALADCTIPANIDLNRYGFVYLVSGLLENNSPI